MGEIENSPTRARILTFLANSAAQRAKVAGCHSGKGWDLRIWRTLQISIKSMETQNRSRRAKINLELVGKVHLVHLRASITPYCEYLNKCASWLQNKRWPQVIGGPGVRPIGVVAVARLLQNTVLIDNLFSNA